MSVGVIVLAHRDLHRVAQMTRAIAQRGCRVVIHVDATTPDAEFDQLAEKLAGNRRISFASRVACEWGGFSLVQAGLMAAATLIDRWPEVTHVAQISGSCLPTRPINELSAFLAANEGVDFVESVPARGQGQSWVVDGLEMERFTLHFPFSYHTQRWLFDTSVELQRKLKMRRKIPGGLEPHLGSQWWCLSRPTLEAILSDKKRYEYDRYFKRCWIPDEAYFPTLVRRHGTKVMSRSLTLSRFDDQGKPHIFYDDHMELLKNSDAFFARKIWAGADKLYRHFLSQKSLSTVRSGAKPGLLAEAFQDARTRRCDARPGRLTQGRFPAASYKAQPKTAVPYTVLQGVTHVFQDLPGWIEQNTGQQTLGRVFKASGVGLLNQGDLLPGGLPATVAFRDYNPEQYLMNLVWNTRVAPPVMLHDLSDSPRINRFVASDPNARLTVVTGTWVLDLLKRDLGNETMLRKFALRLRAQEEKQLEMLRKSQRGVQIVSLSEALSQPLEVMEKAFDIGSLGDAPELRDITGLRVFAERLENLGIGVGRIGDLDAAEAASRRRPELRIVPKSA